MLYTLYSTKSIAILSSIRITQNKLVPEWYCLHQWTFVAGKWGVGGGL